MCKHKHLITLAMALVMCLAAIVPAAFAADAGTLADVPEDHPYYEGIRWCIDNNLMKPDANGSFRPDDTLTVNDMWNAVLASYNPLGESGVYVDHFNRTMNNLIHGMFPISVCGEMTRGQMLSYTYYYLSEDDNLRTADGPRYVRVNDLPPQTKWLRTPQDQRRPEPTEELSNANGKIAHSPRWYELLQNSWAANDDWFDIVGPVNDIKETDIADWDEIAELDPAQPWWIKFLDPEIWLSGAQDIPEPFDFETNQSNGAFGQRYFVNRYLDTVKDHGFTSNRKDTLCTDKESILYMYQLGLAVVQKNASGKIVCNATEPVTRGEFCQVLCNAGLKQELMGQFYNRLYDDWYRGVHDLSSYSEPGIELYRGESEGGVYPERMGLLAYKRDGKYDRSHKPFEAPVDTRNKPPVIAGFSDVAIIWASEYADDGHLTRLYSYWPWYRDAVYWAVDHGIVNGTSPTTFSPDKTCSRSEIITLLYRAKGSPAVADESKRFSDVSSSDWYYNAALWAAQNGLVTGTTFYPNQDATRADVVRYLYRLAGKPDVDGANGFSDVPADDAELASACNWAIAQGITNGTSGNTFSPEKTCTRAEIVTFLYRAYK